MPEPEMAIAPMIDCVFLMLVYFMVTSSLARSEGELELALGTGGGQALDPLEEVDRQTVVIDAEGIARINGFAADSIGRGYRPGLVRQLILFRTGAQQAGGEAKLVVDPVSEAPHQAVIDVLDAAVEAGLTDVRLK